MPHYPAYPSQPYTGKLPTMYDVGPSDLRYTSGTAPHFQSQIDRAHGRYLAGLGAAVQDEDAVVPGTAANELALLAHDDDIRGDGVFDQPGTEKMIHPDAGIFATHFSYPGYLARERMYAESEVIDATTGRPVVFVNGGAVSMDSAAQVAFLERGLYSTPAPVQRAGATHRVPDQSIVNVRVHPAPIAGLGQAPEKPWVWLAGAGALGVLAGAMLAVLRKKGR